MGGGAGRIEGRENCGQNVMYGRRVNIQRKERILKNVLKNAKYADTYKGKMNIIKISKKSEIHSRNETQGFMRYPTLLMGP